MVVRCQQSALANHAAHGRLFRQLLEMLRFYVGFEITDFTGEPLTDAGMLMEHYKAVGAIQVFSALDFLGFLLIKLPTHFKYVVLAFLHPMTVLTSAAFCV